MISCTKLCKYCSKEMLASRCSDYCCHNCSKAVIKGYSPVRPRGQSVDKCVGCGVEFTPAGKQMYCTKKCREMTIGKVAVPCAVCGADVMSRATNASRTCSRECAAEFTRQRLLAMKVARFGPPRTCRNCSKTFTYGGDYFKNFCSKACSKQARFEAKKQEGHERRARARGANIEKFSPTYILKRDNYVCQACGKKTKPKEKSNHPAYPSVDHIVPISMGGEHSKENCRCVCRSCNSKKCNRTLNDQLLLFG